MAISSIKNKTSGRKLLIGNTVWPLNVGSGRGLWAGGSNGSSVQNVIDYVQISNAGNAIDFGDLASSRYMTLGCGSAIKGFFAGGDSTNQSNTATNTIQQVTFSSLGNANSDWGTLTQSRISGMGCGNSTRGLFGGGRTPTEQNTIDYITYSTAGNAVDFGDLSASFSYMGSCSSTTRGLWGGGGPPYGPNTGRTAIYYVEIATTGNTSSFGDLTVARFALAAGSSSTRAVFGGGNRDAPVQNVIDYVTIASTGNATDFGDLTQARHELGATSNSTRAVWGGGAVVNTMDYVDIATTGNATDFGDLTVARYGSTAVSNAHGGL